MAYRNFQLDDLENNFGIKQSIGSVFNLPITTVPPSDLLVQTLAVNRKYFPLTSEKSVSEAIISPILIEVTRNNADKISLFSGSNLDADKANGLNGEIDFLFVHRPRTLQMTSPIINITQAKLNDAIENSIGQAAAQMLGARIFNKKKNKPIETIFGAVTNGDTWIFLKLEDDIICVDNNRFYLQDLGSILGAFNQIVNYYDL